MKKAIALILCAVMAATAFSACNGGGNEQSDPVSEVSSVSNESIQEEESSEVPLTIQYLEKIYTGNAYDGQTFTVLTSGVNERANSEVVYNETLIENFPETVNMAIKRRNDQVYELLGVTIEEIYMRDRNRHSSTTISHIRNIISAGDDTFQAISVCLYDCGTLATQNYLYDLTQLNNIDLDNPWWEKSFSDTVRIAGKQYFMLGDLGVNHKSALPCVYYNRTLLTSLGLEDPQLLVMDGKWTVDKAIELSNSYSNDINDTPGIQWDDCYGWAGQNGDMAVMLYGAGVKILSPDSEGYPELTLWSETANSAVEKVLELMLNPTYYVRGDDYFGRVPYEWPMQALEASFVAGKVLFYSGNTATAISLSEMEDEFGILPAPKLNEEQDDYHSLLGTWSTNGYAIATNVDTEKAEFAAAVLEAMGYYGWSAHADSVAVEFYERVLKLQKLQADDEAAKILDLIFSRSGCDLGDVFQVGKISGQKSVYNFLAELIEQKRTGAFRSTYETYEDILKADAEAVVEYFRDY